MTPLVSDIPPTLGLIIVACITIIPTTLGAYWAHNAKTNSQQAKESSAKALNQVENNGGMEDPNPNLNDHIKYQTLMLENLGQVVSNQGGTLVDVDTRLTDHLEHSAIMDQALSEVYLIVKGIPRDKET